MDRFEVPVAGGALAVHRWPGAGPTVLAAHGITANALSWAAVATALDGRATLCAPDLRGRAGSAGLPGPYGMAAHVADLVAVLDQLGLDRAPIVGHSMGAYIAALAAVRHPDRFGPVLLVDGGVSLPMPAGVDVDAILHAVLGPAMQRLEMTFPTAQAYVEFWRAHPALAHDWSPELEAYVRHDLTGVEPDLRSSCRLEAIRADATDTLLDPQTVAAVHELPGPATLLWAPRGLTGEPPGLYDDARLDAAGIDRSRIAVERVDGVNHYTIVAAPAGAAVVAARLERLTHP